MTENEIRKIAALLGLNVDDPEGTRRALLDLARLLGLEPVEDTQ